MTAGSVEAHGAGTPMRGPAVTSPPSTLDQLLPHPDVVERHTRLVRATPARADAAVRTLTPREVPLVTLLAAVRSLPDRATRRGAARVSSTGRPLVEQALAAGFTVLHDVPGEELVLGLIAQMWRPGGQVVRPAGRAEFLGFAEPGFVKAAMVVRVTPQDGGTRVDTETRVRATDPGARRAFGRYWRLVGPFSSLIRHLLLRGIASRAEAPAPGPGRG